jgi:hypothetical protein
MRQTALVLLGALAACSNQHGRGEDTPSDITPDSADHAFHQLQQRGHIAMGVDQYTSHHRFEPLPDGGLITLERDSADRAGVAQIRSHMQQIAVSFRTGDFAQPGFVHGREVPGTAVMRSRRARISYIPQATPSGGRLQITTQDSAALKAIHEFLAFQRHDHRVTKSAP